MDSMVSKMQNVHAIASDNGTEITDHKDTLEQLKIDFYFAHPCASYERGSIENLNRLVRQCVPRGTDFTDVQNTEVKEVQNKLKILTLFM